MSRPILTQGRLKELFDYDPETGVFTRKISMGSRGRKGSRVGHDDGTGYLQTTIDGERHRMHRLAMFHMTGVWPAEDVDHINRVRNDNRACNLRAVTRAENSHNKCKSRNNTSGYLGVSWVPSICKWEARIVWNGKPKVLGYYKTPELASDAYRSAKLIYHPTAPVAQQGA
jgi:hypothetical protein